MSAPWACVHSVGPMCPVLGLMCPVLGPMCPLWRAMCSIFGGARPSVQRSAGRNAPGTWQVVRGDGEWLVKRVAVGLGGIVGRTGAVEGGCWQ